MARRIDKAANQPTNIATQESPQKNQAPMKTCRACGAKTHVRNKTCDHCSYEFSGPASRPLSTEETVETVFAAMDLVRRLGEGEAVKLIRKVASEL